MAEIRKGNILLMTSQKSTDAIVTPGLADTIPSCVRVLNDEEDWRRKERKAFSRWVCGRGYSDAKNRRLCTVLSVLHFALRGCMNRMNKATVQYLDLFDHYQ